MRRSLATITFASSVALLSACADSPTGPAAVEPPPSVESPPSEIVAGTNTLFQLGSLAAFANGGVNVINTSGQTAGWSNQPSGAYHAIVRELDGTVTDLGTLNGTGSVALGMNDAATVVGLSYIAGNTTYHAFASEIISGARLLVDLPVLPGTVATTARCAAYGVNDNGGTIVGFCYALDGKQHAVRWTRVSPGVYSILDLHPASGWTRTFAYDVNNSGTVVGFGLQASGTMLGFKYVPSSPVAGTLTSLPPFANGLSSCARAINNSGDIVGWGANAAGVYHAWGVYSISPAAPYDLGATTTGPSYAFDINDNRQAVGWAQPSAGVYQPLFWNAALTPTDIGTLPTATSAQAQGINARGQIVGISGTSAVVWFTSPNTNPVANAGTAYTITRSNGQAILTLDGSKSSDADGDLINSYTWTFSGGGGTATGVAPTHTYSTSGSYTVRLVVTDWRGGTSTASTATITVK